MRSTDDLILYRIQIAVEIFDESLSEILIRIRNEPVIFTDDELIDFLPSILCDLVMKTEGAASLLEQAFADCSAQFVFIFGSMAKGTANANSDIDLFVIGNCGLREITRRIHSVAPQIGQEVNPYAISQDDFIRRLHENDHFLREIINTPKIFLKGTENEFIAMAK